MACRLRFEHPKPELVIAETGTSLGYDVVSAIIESALRLLPIDNTPEGIRKRQAKEIEKANKADDAESAFVVRLLEVDPQLLRESQQQTQIKAALEAGQHNVVRLTPDALLSRCVRICGRDCAWVEFKNTFGFRLSPFVAARNKKQFRKYASSLSPGMVVYKLGYEMDHVKIEGTF
ncbi:hypothetical protein LTR56_025008 [Elasticomyces elasticus]|nr:hypothetical protein LTR56_025008 [Elasticomyces elasticus]KAK3645810.1 hypothetical protein LTR22_014578 [Elasticomyces elasticus]KAK4906613.1 hypothetical protein LTR49_024260 [Elasticomyces elasticus]KAK5741553.1 hypothetical protein LTS12_024561 [Elasticomyces elasticus]